LQWEGKGSDKPDFRFEMGGGCFEWRAYVVLLGEWRREEYKREITLLFKRGVK